MLDHDDRVALVDEPAQDVEQLARVVEVEPRGGLVEDVEGVPGGPAAELARQLHPLGLAAGQGRRRLAEPDVAQSHVDQRLHVPGDRRLALEEDQGLLARHVEHVGDRLAAEGDLEGVAVVARPVAGLAGHVASGRRCISILMVPSPAQASHRPPRTLNENRPG